VVIPSGHPIIVCYERESCGTTITRFTVGLVIDGSGGYSPGV